VQAGAGTLRLRGGVKGDDDSRVGVDEEEGRRLRILHLRPRPRLRVLCLRLRARRIWALLAQPLLRRHLLDGSCSPPGPCSLRRICATAAARALETTRAATASYSRRRRTS
jgi:hypothetical protein